MRRWMVPVVGALVLAVVVGVFVTTRPTHRWDQSKVIAFDPDPVPRKLIGSRGPSAEGQSHLRLNARVLRQRIVRGEPLRLVLTVGNPTEDPVTLEPCPWFAVTVSTAAEEPVLTDASYLNCADGPRSVPSHGHVTFAYEVRDTMRLPLADPLDVYGRLSVGSRCCSELTGTSLTVVPARP